MNHDDDRQSFYDQPAYTPLNASDASLILSHYSPKPYHSHRHIPGGIANSNYCIISEDQSYYFCKICDEMTEENISIQLKALLALRSYKLPLAYPLKRQKSLNTRSDGTNTDKEVSNSDEASDNYILRISSIQPPIVMYEWKVGRVEKFPTLSFVSYVSLGTALARLHSIVPDDFLYLPSPSMGLAQMLPLYCKELPTLSSSLKEHSFIAVLQRELQSICQTLYQKTPYEVYRDRDYIVTKDTRKEDSNNQRKSLPVAILHADLFLENILFQPNGELDAIIDWECISIGERLIDVTMVLVGCCYDCTDTLSIPRAAAFLSAYRNILTFTLSERLYFETFLRYSLLSIACERWYRFNVRFSDNQRCDSYLSMLTRMDNIDSEIIQQLLSTETT